MRKPAFTKKQFNEMYEKAISCRNKKEIKSVITKYAINNNISYRSTYNSLNNYCRANSLDIPGKVVSDRFYKELSEIISKNPSNINQCFRDYIAQTYPEITNKNEINKHFYRISEAWYDRISKKHTCFMTVSSTGQKCINRKTNKIINVYYKRSFLRSLTNKIKQLFK